MASKKDYMNMAAFALMATSGYGCIARATPAQDDFLRLEEFSYEDVMEAMQMGADALAQTISLNP